jgi:hypothetical protein
VIVERRQNTAQHGIINPAIDPYPHSGWKFDLDPTRRRLPARRHVAAGLVLSVG